VHPRTGSAVRPSNTAGSKLRRPLLQLTGSENPHQDHDALQSTPRPEAVRLPREQRPQTLMDDTPSWPEPPCRAPIWTRTVSSSPQGRALPGELGVRPATPPRRPGRHRGRWPTSPCSSAH